MTETSFAIVQLVERLHRQFLDVLRIELRACGIDEVNAVQALLLANIGMESEKLVIRDLKDRGYYHGSNVSYNIKKLTDLGLVAQERSDTDRRSTHLSLTEKGRAVARHVTELQTYLARKMGEDGISTTNLDKARMTLEGVERTWDSFIREGGR